MEDLDSLYLFIYYYIYYILLYFITLYLLNHTLGKHFPDTLMIPEPFASVFKKDEFDENNKAPQNATKKHKLLTQAEKALVSESLINLLYDWKKHNTPKTTNNARIYSEKTSANLIDNPYTPEKNEPITINKKTASPFVDLQKKLDDDTNTGSTESASAVPSGIVDTSASTANELSTELNGEISPSSQENTANAVSQEKERFNVLVNVNINERAARRSDVDQHGEFSTSASRRSKVDHVNRSFPLEYSINTNDPLSIRTVSFQDKAHSTKTSHKVFGALKKLQEEAKSEDEEEESGDSLDNSGSSGSVNKTSNPVVVKAIKSIARKLNSENEVNEAEADSDLTEVDSGSGEKELEEGTLIKPSDLKKTKVTGGNIIPQKTKTLHKVDGVSNRPVESISKKKYNPKHAQEEEKEALKGETPADTIIANKVAADRESKDNNLEQNDIPVIKTDKKKVKEDSNDINSNKAKNTGPSEELKEVVDDVKFGKSNSSEAEDVRIEQVKSPATPKAIPLEAAIGSNQPIAKMPSEIKEDSENEEIMFTKKEREEALKKLGKKNDKVLKNTEKKKSESENTETKKTESDDKYETLAEVREKFKKWENKIEGKNIEIPENTEENEKDRSEKFSAKVENSEVIAQDKDSDTENIKAAESDAKKNEDIPKVETKDKNELSAKDFKTVAVKDAIKEIPKLVSSIANKTVLQEKNDIIENKDIEKHVEGKATKGEIIMKILPDQLITKSNAASPVSSWKDEKKVILKKLRNPFSEENNTVHKVDEDDDNVEDDDEKEQQMKSKEEANQVPKISKKEKARFLAGINRLKAKELREKQNLKNEESNNKKDSDKVIDTNLVDKESNHSAREAGPIEKIGTIQDKDSLKELIASQVADDLKNNSVSAISIKANSQSLKQLQHFKNQILSEVEKINRLEAEYGVEDHSTRDLDEAKDVLKKDLKVVKELEKTLLKKSKAKEVPKEQTFPKKPTSHRHIYYQPTSVMEAQQLQAAAIKEQEKAEAYNKQIASTLKQKTESDVSALKQSTKEVLEEEDAEIIPEAKLGFETSDEDNDDDEDKDKETEEKKENKKKLRNRKKIGQQFKFKKIPNRATKNHHHHPLAELHSLLKAEIRRLRLPNRGRNDPQLSNIRQLVQQRLKSMLENGDLDKAAVHNLTPDIKELGMLLKKRIQSEKKRKLRKIKKGKKKERSSHFMNAPEKKPLKHFNKMNEPNSQVNILNKEISSLQKNIAVINKPANAHETPYLQQTTSSAPSLTVHLSPNTTISSQSNQMKNLLTTLNRKLGEIYAKANGVHHPNAPHSVQAYPMAPPHAQPISPPANLVNQFSPGHNYTITSFKKPSEKAPVPKPILIPSTFVQTPIENPAQSVHSQYNHPASKCSKLL